MPDSTPIATAERITGGVHVDRQHDSAHKHVTGDAVDVAPTAAAYWMSQHGDRFGLCQAYAKEIWHYELLTEPGGTCPDAQVR